LSQDDLRQDDLPRADLDPDEQPLDDRSAGTGLWSGDTGVLHERTRRVLLELLKGPYVSGAQNPGLWAALIADETSVRSRLHELFLDLVIDPVDEFAFTRKVVTEEIDVPSAVRSERLTFIDTAMLLVLRQLLLAAPGERRVIVGKDEVYDSLMIYRTGDESTFLRNLNGAWARMSNRLRVLHKVGDERFEISPMVRFLIDEDRVRELTATYRRIAAGDDGDNAEVDDLVGDTGTGDNLGEDGPDSDSDVPDPDRTPTDTTTEEDAE
jgi:hypothetical protein